MDQHETLTKAPDEADVPGPSSSSQHHHRPHHQGAPHHDDHSHLISFHNMHPNALAHHRGETHHHSRAHPPHDRVHHPHNRGQSPPSLSTVPPSGADGEDRPSHPESNRLFHHRDTHSPSRPHAHRGGHHHQREAHPHASSHHSKSHYQDEHAAESHHAGNPRHPTEAHHHGRVHHHHRSRHHEGTVHHGEISSHQPTDRHPPPEQHPSESHPREHPHHAERVHHSAPPHREQRPAEPQQQRGDSKDRQQRLLGEQSQRPSSSRLAPPLSSFPSEQPQLKSSGKPKYPHHTPDHLQTAQAFNKVHPLAAFSPSTATRRTEEQFLKHKQPRNQHLHRRLRSEGLSQLLCKNLCNCIQWLRKRILFLVDSLAFEIFIFLIITLNTIMMVAQTFAEVEIRGEWYFTAIDTLFLSIYVVEAMLKIIALGFSYFSDPWNKLDFFIMLTSALDFTLAQLKHTLSHSIFNQNIFRIFKVLKSLRALRAIQVLRSFRILRNLQEVTETLAGSLPSITAILILMFTCLLLFSVVLRALFRHSDPKRFQNIFTTVFTLFIMLTLDDWSYIYLDSWAQGAWYIVPILMIYIIIQYFIFLNLVIAVLVDNFQMALLRGLEKEKLERAARTQEKLLDDSMTELNKADAEEMSEDVLHNQLMEKKFGDMTDKQKELLFHFLQLVAGVEHLQLKFRSQACVIDEIVDTTFEAGEEDFRK